MTPKEATQTAHRKRKLYRRMGDRATEAIIASEGLTPLQVILGTMRELVARAQKLAEEAESDPAKCMLRDALLNKACQHAVEAAPCVHPRMMAIEAHVEGNVEIKEVRWSVVTPKLEHKLVQ